MSTPRDPDRLVLFTDAVVAIAITLLVLPLVDLVPEVRSDGGDAVSVITDHRQELFTFLLSFVVIANFWLGHHRVFEHVRAYNPLLMRLNLLWLLAIVVLPFPTEIIGTFDSDRFTAGIYVGTILVLSILQSAITWLVHGHKELEDPDNPVSKRQLVGTLLLTGLTVVAFLLAALVPGVNFYAMLLLLLSPLLMPVWSKRFTRQEQSTTHTGAQQ
ncbi:TMEM175 family protein [Kribbella sp. NPDC004875]|uniref:TMEM175 family protein n=1 Tax=Kribbella sp. NPDC004875 TaxID=3364107 RepID=UPI0036C74D97